MSVSGYHIFIFSRQVYFIKKKFKQPVHTILKAVHSYVVLVIKTCGGGDPTPAVAVTVQERLLHPSTPYIGECHITSTRGNTEKHSNLHPHSFNRTLKHKIMLIHLFFSRGIIYICSICLLSWSFGKNPNYHKIGIYLCSWAMKI